MRSGEWPGVGVGLEAVTPADAVAIDLQGRRLGGPTRMHLGLTPHSGVHEERPDVGSVAHAHPGWAAALGARRAPAIGMAAG